MRRRGHRKSHDTATIDRAEAALTASDPSDHDQPLRNELGRILGVDPETLHPDKGRRADA